MDTCVALSQCVGTQRTCDSIPGQCYDAGTCSTGSGSCVYPIAIGQQLRRPRICAGDIADRCAADGTCAGTATTCNKPDGGCFIAPGTCDSASGACIYAVDAGASCDDHNACTTGDVCSATGACQGHSVSCNTPPECQMGGMCASDGGCVYTPTVGGFCQSGTGVCVNGMCQGFVTFTYVPSNFSPPDAGWSPPVTIASTCDPDFNSSGSGSFDKTCAMTMPAPVGVTLSDGTPALLLPFGSLTVSLGATFTIHGDKPVILAVLGDATLLGTINGSSQGAIVGPGSGAHRSEKAAATATSAPGTTARTRAAARAAQASAPRAVQAQARA